jgi:ubiquinone/menaquinone biosynthesis C-methylase UbiE
VGSYKVSKIRVIALCFSVGMTHTAVAVDDEDCFLRHALKELGVENENVTVSARQYEQVNSRNLSNLSKDVGSKCVRTLMQLSPGSEILDSGGGFSIYGLELAKKGIRVTTVNAQDFYRDALLPLTDLKEARKYLVRLNDLTESTKGGISNRGLLNMMKALDIRIPNAFIDDHGFLIPAKNTSIEEAASALTKLAGEISSKVAQKEKEGLFVRITDLVQNFLRRTPSNSKNEIIDAFGAYYYSTDRIELLEEYFRILKPGGQGHISLAFTADKVKLGDNTVALQDFLVQTFPDAFEISSSSSLVTTLIIKKSGTPPDFAKLKSILGKPKIEWIRGRSKTSLSRPKLEFRAKH